MLHTEIDVFFQLFPILTYGLIIAAQLNNQEVLLNNFI